MKMSNFLNYLISIFRYIEISHFRYIECQTVNISKCSAFDMSNCRAFDASIYRNIGVSSNISNCRYIEISHLRSIKISKIRYYQISSFRKNKKYRNIEFSFNFRYIVSGLFCSFPSSGIPSFLMLIHTEQKVQCGEYRIWKLFFFFFLSALYRSRFSFDIQH